MRINKIDLGKVVKPARLKKGWTQEFLAEKVGVGLRHIMGIENEGHYPSFEVLCKLIWELNLPADSIFYPEQYPVDSQREYLIHLLGQCDDRDIQAVTALVESLVNKPEHK